MRFGDRLDVLYSHAARVDIPELTRLATTIETWWLAIEAFCGACHQRQNRGLLH